ncbi:MAG: histidine kinase, partial [Methylococcales bacterium]|nr:histidine kinase [Methylococcales bacterium]
ELAEELVEDLAELIRASMHVDQALLIKLEEEIKLVKLYLAIEYHRLNQRLKVIWEMDNIPTNALIPPLSLQPIVENAVYYGVEPSTNGAEIVIKGEKTLTGIMLMVRNTRSDQPACTQRKGNQVAMENLSARIAGCFAGDGRVVINSSPEFYQVTIQIPYRTNI